MAFRTPSQKGFTLIEVSLVASIFFILVGLATVNLFKFQHKSQLSSALTSFLADMKEQQIKAMVGDTEGTTTISDYGVHFETSSYTLFRNTYNTGNFVISLPSNLQITSPVTGSQVLFSKGSGELSGTTSATIILKDTVDNTQKVINLNRYGVVTGVN